MHRPVKDHTAESKLHRRTSMARKNWISYTFVTVTDYDLPGYALYNCIMLFSYEDGVRTAAAAVEAAHRNRMPTCDVVQKLVWL